MVNEPEYRKEEQGSGKEEQGSADNGQYRVPGSDSQPDPGTEQREDCDGTGMRLESESVAEEEESEAVAGDAEALEWQKTLEEVTRQRDEYLRLLQRVQADFENFKRRAERQRFETVQRANEELLEKILPLVDDLERALANAQHDTPAEALIEGVRLIHRQFLDILAREGVEPIAAEGEQFDPQKHEAVMQQECRDIPEGTVLEEYRRGYCLRDRVIRPCMVKVAVSPESPPGEAEGQAKTDGAGENDGPGA